MSTLAEYEAWKAKQQQGGVAAAQTVLAGADAKPDELAGDINLANEFAKTIGAPVPPLPLVKENRSVFQKEIERQRAGTILGKSPRLTEWLRDPDNAVVAQDDLSNLSWFEGFGRGLGATLKRSGLRVKQAGQQAMFESTAGRAADRKKTFGELVEDQKIKMTDMDGNPIKVAAGPGEWLGAMANWIDARYADAIGTNDDASAREWAKRISDTTTKIAETPKSMIARDFEDDARVEGGTLGETLASYGAAFIRNPVGGLSWMVETAGESAPTMAAAIGTTLVTRNPAAGAGVMGGGSYLTERYISPVEFLKEKKIDLSKPEQVNALLANPELMREMAERGVIRGLVIGSFDMLSVGIAGRSFAGNPVVEVLAQGVTQAFMGSGGEYAARVAAGQEIDWNEIVAEGLAEFATAPVDMGIAGRRVFRDRARSKKAEETKEQVDQLAATADASALRARLPDKFRQYLEGALENGPAESVYIPANEFVGYFQSIGVDPHEIADTLDGVTREDLDTAISSGGDLKMPTATYAAKIAGTDHDAFFAENLRFDPDEFTSKEATEFNARAKEEMEEAYRVAEEARREEERWRPFEIQIYDEMVSRLRAAGRSTDVATAEAALYPAFYRTMSGRSGLTVEEFMQRYALPRVEGALPQGLQYRDVNEIDRLLGEARSRKTVRDSRQTLLEFIHEYGGINDIGGELRNMGADVIKRGRGRKTLKLARSAPGQMTADLVGGDADGKRFGADDVARAVIEAGFLADNPIATEYEAALREGKQVPDITAALWEAIDKEVRGEAQYSILDVPPQSADEQAVLDEIEEYLAGVGLSLDDDNATIKKAIGDGRQYGQDARGSVQFPAGGVASGEAVIRLFETANLSTFLHESGHFYLEVMRDLAARGEGSATAELATIREWWQENAAAVAKDAKKAGGVEVSEADVATYLEAGTTGDAAKDQAIDTGLHEQWARGFEAYVMEGRAPSADLRGAFEKFRSWLISIYKRLRGLDVNISDNMRRVFDRMIASDQEIARAQEEVGDAVPTFASAEHMGLTPEEYAKYLKLKTQAEEGAKARVLREVMAPIKRETEAWYKEERAKVATEVEREVNAHRYFRAIEWMGNKRWLGEGRPDELPDMRLSKDILVARYGAGILKTLPRGKQTVYAVKGGLDPDEAAGWFGFGSGDELVRSMETAPKRLEAIEAETERVMRERHGDVLTSGEVEARALEAVHSERRGDWIAAELQAVVEVSGTGQALKVREARASARQAISRMRLRDATDAKRFLAAERKASQEAARLGATLSRDKIWLAAATRRIQSRLNPKGVVTPQSVENLNAAIQRRNQMLEGQTVEYEVEEREVTGKDGKTRRIKGGTRTAEISGYNQNVAKLIDAKRRQLINHALYIEATNATKEVERAERFVQSLGKKSKREQIAGAGRRENAQVDYLGAIDEVLERYSFRRISRAAEQRRGALVEFIEKMKAAGRENELAIPDNVMAETVTKKPYKTLPTEEFRGVIDTLKNLEHMALRWNKLIDAQRERDRDAIVEDIVAAFEANVKKRPPGRVRTKQEERRGYVRKYLDLVLNATTLLREIDGFQDDGATYRNVKGPIDEAMSRLAIRKEKAATDLEGLYSVYSKAERREMAVRKFIPEFGLSLSKWELIAIALNTGNADNLQRLTDPKVRGSFTDAQVAVAVGKLDARDARFVQSVWDYVGSFWDDIAARERRTTGVEPKKVEPTPISIAGLDLRGGYYPIKYDPRLSTLARDDETQTLAESLQAGRFGKAQTRNGHLKARAQSSGRDVDIDMSVLHGHVNQVIYDLELSEPVTSSWRILQDGRVRERFIEAGKQADFDALEIWLKDVAEGEIRSAEWVGQQARRLKSNFTAAKLAFNLSTVALQVTGLAQTMVVVGKKDFALGVRDMFRPGVEADIVAKSAFMQTRRTTFNKDIYDMNNDPVTGPVVSRWAEGRNFVAGKLGFWLMTKVQWWSVDVPTWLAGYQQGLRQFGGDEARAIAHADGIVKRAQASGLFSDRSAVERGSVSRTARQNDVVRLFTTLGSYMFAKFNVAYERTAVAKRTIAEEGVSTKSAQEALSWLLDMSFLFVLEAIVMAAIKGGLPDDDDEDDTWLKFLGKETAFGVMGTMPFVRDVAGPIQGYDGGGAYGAITKEIGAPVVQIFQGEADKALVKSIINATGLATGLPATQINRAVDAGWRQMEGEDVSPVEYLLGRSKK